MSDGNGQLIKRTRVDGDPILMNRMMEMAHNSATSRSQFLSQFIDRRRNIDDECGFPETGSMTPQAYRGFFDREAVANRVVEIWPLECWAAPPEIIEEIKEDDPEALTPFEEAWHEIAMNLKTESWFKDPEVNPIWEYMRRLDIMSGIGKFGVMLLGIDDGLPLDHPAAGIEEENSFDKQSFSVLQEDTAIPVYNLAVNAAETEGRKLIYLRVFDESLVQIPRYENNITSPRYGQPIEYLITFNDPSLPQTGTGVDIATRKVHWSRVIHVADNLMSSEVVGVPRMQSVFNNLYNLKKLYSGSAEGYWQASSPFLSFETHPQLGGDVEFDLQGMKDQMENVRNSLQKEIFSTGLSVKSVGPTVSDPATQIDTQITAICIKISVPKRIFLGSERGELSSSQDEGDWDDKVRSRNLNHTTPRIIIPTIDRLIMVGVLPEPKQYKVQWPDNSALSDLEKADIATKQIEMLVKFIAGGGTQIMTEEDFLVRFLHIPKDEADAILEAARKQAEEEMEEREQLADEQGVELDLDGNPIPVEEPVDEEKEAPTEDEEAIAAESNGGGNRKTKGTPVAAAAK